MRMKPAVSINSPQEEERDTPLMAAKLPLSVAIALLQAIMFAGATEFIVGDETGWIVGKNYTKWTENKDFKVGDKLVFQYMAVQHDVFWVGEPEFNSCKTSPYIEHQTSGNDEFLLTTPGRRWYICGKSNHCTSGMKLATIE
ncbi:hypothetical protein KSP40_PGU013071 [Platanthera guangdongensis]|uniref:Phytocyanin domain-containing protein n=1 Tax=Platanthera guangdongensis TaxID=2320717 RepID=A0ABR2MFG2_9ASPA